MEHITLKNICDNFITDKNITILSIYHILRLVLILSIGLLPLPGSCHGHGSSPCHDCQVQTQVHTTTSVFHLWNSASRWNFWLGSPVFVSPKVIFWILSIYNHLGGKSKPVFSVCLFEVFLTSCFFWISWRIQTSLSENRN